MNQFLLFLTQNLRPIFSEESKIFLKIGNIQIAWYAVIIISGAFLAMFFVYFHFFKRLNIKFDVLFEGLIYGLFFGILGARLYYVIFSGDTYESFLDIIDPRSGGLAIHGGLIGAVSFIIIYAKIKKLNLITLLEIAMPIFMFCHAVGRWGNFVNQEAFGSLIKYPGFVSADIPLTDEALIAQRDFLKSLLIPNFIIDRMYIPYSNAAGFTVAGYYHPTFLYESFFNLIGCTLYMTVRKFVKKIYVGDALGFYLVWYGALRIFIESLRSDPLMVGNLKVAQVISIVMITLGILILVLRRVFKYKMISCYDALYGKTATLIALDENTKVLIFDCDGTILDTFELIENIVFETFKKVNPNYPLTKDEAHSFFGPYINDTFKKYAKDEEELNLYIDTYNNFAKELTPKYIKAYENMKETLILLKKQGYIIAVASNKIKKEVERGLKICKLSDYVDDIIGAEMMDKPKPDPSCIKFILNKYHVKNSIMIGDSHNDILAGKRANVYTCGVTWCVTKEEEFKSLGADEIVNSPIDLIKIGEEYANRL